MSSVTVREYNADSGALLGNINVLSFGRITAGTTSAVKVIDLVFSGVTYAGNIKLGLISSGGLSASTSETGEVYTDQSCEFGRFGIEHSSVFNSVTASSALTKHFQGINTTVTSSDGKNVSIGNRDATTSEYIYLDIEISASNVSAGNGSWKIFFDFS